MTVKELLKILSTIPYYTDVCIDKGKSVYPIDKVYIEQNRIILK